MIPLPYKETPQRFWLPRRLCGRRIRRKNIQVNDLTPAIELDAGMTHLVQPNFGEKTGRVLALHLTPEYEV
jgi:hypothetical protein